MVEYVNPGEKATASKINEIIDAIDEAKVDAINETKTQNLMDQKSNRALDTVYQNITSRHLLVMVSAGGHGVRAYTIGYISEDNSTFNQEAYCNVGGSNLSGDRYPFIAFVVPPNYYYKVISKYYDDSWHTSSIQTWWEVEI